MRCHVVLSVVLMFAAIDGAEAQDCGKTLGLHGFKATAQVVCRFGQRENQGLDWARSCARQQDPGLNVMEIRKGAEVFQATVNRMGKAAACRSVLRDFAGVLFRR